MFIKHGCSLLPVFRIVFKMPRSSGHWHCTPTGLWLCKGTFSSHHCVYTACQHCGSGIWNRRLIHAQPQNWAISHSGDASESLAQLLLRLLCLIIQILHKSSHFHSLSLLLHRSLSSCLSSSRSLPIYTQLLVFSDHKCIEL